MRNGLKSIWQYRVLRLNKCKPLILAFSLIFAFVVMTGSTLAWFISIDSSVNNLQAPPDEKFSVSVVDVFNPTPRPDKTYSKRVGAANLSEKPAFVRILVMPSFLAADGSTVLPATFGTHVMLEDLNLAAWNGAGWIGGDWAYGGDGYFYYLHVLPGNTSTDISGLNQNLFNAVKVADNLPAEYKNAHLRIEVKCEAVNTKKWNYRSGWWGKDTAPASPPLSDIDAVLSAMAQ